MVRGPPRGPGPAPAGRPRPACLLLPRRDAAASPSSVRARPVGAVCEAPRQGRAGARRGGGGERIRIPGPRTSPTAPVTPRIPPLYRPIQLVTPESGRALAGTVQELQVVGAAAAAAAAAVGMNEIASGASSPHLPSWPSVRGPGALDGKSPLRRTCLQPEVGGGPGAPAPRPVRSSARPRATPSAMACPPGASSPAARRRGRPCEGRGAPRPPPRPPTLRDSAAGPASASTRPPARGSPAPGSPRTGGPVSSVLGLERPFEQPSALFSDKDFNMKIEWLWTQHFHLRTLQKFSNILKFKFKNIC